MKTKYKYVWIAAAVLIVGWLVIGYW